MVPGHAADADHRGIVRGQLFEGLLAVLRFQGRRGDDGADHAVLGGYAHEPVHLGHFGAGRGIRFDMYGPDDIDALERGPVVFRSIPLLQGVEALQPGIA